MASHSSASSLQKIPDQRSKSCETACSSNSSCFFQKRKPNNPLAYSLRSSLSKSSPNTVKQRVLSAKLLKVKSLQNQLNDANFHLAEVIRENQALKTLQKRQDKALSKYEGANAELPRLIKSHEEELRFLTEKNRILRKSLKELNEQMKFKSEELSSLQEQIKHYEKLDKDKHLSEREKLVEDVQDLKAKLEKAHNEIVVLNRKLTLESKTSKQRLNMEMVKHKQCQRELAQSLSDVNRLTKLLESKEKSMTSNGRKRFSNLTQRESTSLISLNGTKLESVDKVPVTEIKLQPIVKEIDNREKQNFKGILRCPSENIRARLSAESMKELEDAVPSVDKLSLSESESLCDKEHQSRPPSVKKIEKIETNLQNTIKKMEDNKNSDEFSKRMGDYCLKALDSVKNCSNVIDTHRENLSFIKKDTEKILETVKDTQNLEQRLQLSLEKNDDNLDFVSAILKEEADFQAKYQDRFKNGKKMESSVDKKKLLATLKAIDNGDSVESETRDDIREIFGSVH